MKYIKQNAEQNMPGFALACGLQQTSLDHLLPQEFRRQCVPTPFGCRRMLQPFIQQFEKANDED